MSYKDFLTEAQVQCVLQSHCDRVLSSMSYDDLLSYAKQMMRASFGKDPGQANFEMLLFSIAVQEDNDEDSIGEFLLGCGIATHVVDMIMKEHEF
jgi:hypothetical protein